MQAYTAETTPIALENDGIEVRAAEAGQMTVGFFRLKQGTDLGPALVGLPDDCCPCPHWGYMLEGRLLMRMPGGDQTYEAGQAFYWGPGHAPFALTDCAYVDFSPSAELAAVVKHITGG
jgi:hypothetical protein